MQFCILIIQNNPKFNIIINRLFFIFASNLYYTIEYYIAAINKIKIFTTTTAIQNILSNIFDKRDFTTLLHYLLMYYLN